MNRTAYIILDMNNGQRVGMRFYASVDDAARDARRYHLIRRHRMLVASAVFC